MSSNAAETDIRRSKSGSSHAATNPGARRSWVHELADVVKETNLSVEPRMRTSISCDTRPEQSVLYLPPETAKLQPRSIHYLHAFAKANNFRLANDRRSSQVQPIQEQRDRKPPMIALGMSLLLKQTGIPGAARTLSSPHHLNADSKHVGLAQLIKMAAFSAPKSKRVVVPPNRIIINTLKDTQPISAYACRLNYAKNTSILTHFDSSYFKAIGYTTGSQYIMHVCLGGGSQANASLWTQLPSLTNTDFKFQLYPAKRTADDFGLFYITFYLDLAKEPVPWWVQEQLTQSADTHKWDSSENQTQRKAS